ncbi:MXAN_6230/SCO0854 family RING domain-containing protein [Micromonospora costi]|nr:MXAN_6230/SCO0854 family RING domain-containing protein [Micromonospora costi]
MATQTRTQTARTRPATLVRVLLRRRGTVYVPAGTDQFNPDARPGVTLLEADLAERGWLLSQPLRDALLRLDTVDLTALGSRLLADCDELVGGGRDHTPLFRRFPDRVPNDTLGLFVDRILTAWFQEPTQPCVLCFAAGTVRPVNPCGHLVCGDCFRPADYSACPICYRQLDPADPYLAAGEPAVEDRPREPREVTGPAPARLRVLHLGGGLLAQVRAEVLSLLARPTALPPADADDLAVMLAGLDRTDVSWLPAAVPGRETKARLLAWLLADPVDPAVVEAHVTALVDTATDVLRFLVARSGGESLIDRPRIAPVARPLRRVLLAALDRMGVVQLVEDMRRHRRAWIAVGERLHPGEHAGRWPNVALAFAALRGTTLNQVQAAALMLNDRTASAEHVHVRDGRVLIAVRARRVEEALAARDLTAALGALRARPGELLRRADHLLRIGAGRHNALVEEIGRAARQAAPAVILSALGEIRTRAVAHDQRVFFPAGRTGTAHVVEDARSPLAPHLVGQAERALKAALFERAAALPAVDRAVVDTDLEGIIAPFTERTAARALVTLARGSVLPIPAGQVVRLFLHWMESEQRVDLDLSVAVYSKTWEHVGTCDFTNLRLPGAVHSGDFTSAPAPRGASEFIDLDVDVLAKQGGRYAVMSVLSYNNVPFLDMAEAFAGFMVRDQLGGRREPFDARAVEQRFDLTGPGKVTIPFVVDLHARTMRWLDVAAKVTGTNHAVHRHADQFSTVARALVASFEAGGRVTLGELGRWIAAARAREVIVRSPAGMTLFRRADHESVSTFALRLRTGLSSSPATAEDAASAALQFVARGDLPTPDGAEVYALHPGQLDAGRVRLLAAPDVPAMLAPPGP